MTQGATSGFPDEADGNPGKNPKQKAGNVSRETFPVFYFHSPL